MSPSDVSSALVSLIPTRRPIWIWGPPGAGKSSVVKKAIDTLGLQLIDVRATLLDATDLRGLPKVEGNRVKWCPPVFLPQDGEGVLFLDELAQAAPLVQSACLQLVLDRKIGEYELPPGYTVIAASNRSEDRAGTHRVISPLLNRFVHLEMHVSGDDWQEWAVVNNIAAEVRAFLRFRPAMLFQVDTASNPRAFPTPRSWQFVSDVLRHTPKNLVQQVVAGCVGDGPAAEFQGYLELYQQLPDIDSFLASPTTSPIPREPAVLYALVGALVERVKNDKGKAPNFVKYAARLPDEFAMLSLRDVLAVDRTLVALPSLNEWVAQARAKGMFIAA